MNIIGAILSGIGKTVVFFIRLFAGDSGDNEKKDEYFTNNGDEE